MPTNRKLRGTDKWKSVLPVLSVCCAIVRLPPARSGCWKPAVYLEFRCEEAQSNRLPELDRSSSLRRLLGIQPPWLGGGNNCGADCEAGRRLLWHGDGPWRDGGAECGSDCEAGRRLLWHGGGGEFKDIPDHNLGEGQKYRGDGGTIHQYELTGQKVATPGSDDMDMFHAYDIESRFYSFNEGRSDRGKNEIFGREDGWFDELLKCDNTDMSLQMCQKCGKHCNAWEWKTSGYSILNSTEVEIEDLTWMTHNTYITKSFILPLR